MRQRSPRTIRKLVAARAAAFVAVIATAGIIAALQRWGIFVGPDEHAEIRQILTELAQAAAVALAVNVIGRATRPRGPGDDDPGDAIEEDRAA
jgi:hypothetical protein